MLSLVITCSSSYYQIALHKQTSRMLQYSYQSVQSVFTLSDKDDVFLLPRMDQTKLTVLQLDLSKAFAANFDLDINGWRQDENLPIGLPILEMVLPVYGGQIQFLALDKQRGLGLLIILDTVIIFEFSSEA